MDPRSVSIEITESSLSLSISRDRASIPSVESGSDATLPKARLVFSAKLVTAMKLPEANPSAIVGLCCRFDKDDESLQMSESCNPFALCPSTDESWEECVPHSSFDLDQLSTVKGDDCFGQYRLVSEKQSRHEQ